MVVAYRGHPASGDRPEPGPAGVLIGRRELEGRVSELGRELSRAYPDGLVLVGVLHSSVWFLSDLVRRITAPTVVDFIGITSYGEERRARVVKDVETDLAGRSVVAVDTLADTGLTLSFVVTELIRRGAASVEICVLLDQRQRRIVPIPVRFRGFFGPDQRAVGYGLDHRSRYRNLPFLAALGTEAVMGSGDISVDPFAL